MNEATHNTQRTFGRANRLLIIMLSLFSSQYLEDFAGIAVIFSGLLFFTLTAALSAKYWQMGDK